MRNIALVIILLLSMSPFTEVEGRQDIRDGVLDLRDEDITSKYHINLNGEWEFYWKKHYRPHHFSGDIKPKPDGFIRVPSYWTEMTLNGKKPENYGYATYRLTILLPPGNLPPLGLDVKVMDSSYDLYINGQFLGSNGVTGTTPESSLPGYKPTIYRFIPENDTIEILFNVSNYHHRRGGFWLPVEFGSFAKIQTTAAINWGRSVSNVSVLVAFTVFFIFFFILYPSDKVSLFFAIALIGLAFRPLFNGQFLIYLFTSPPWTTIVRLEYISLYVALIGAHFFLYHLFRSNYQRYCAIAATIILLVVLVATLILPVSTFSYFVFTGYFFVALFAVNSILCSGLRFIKNRQIVDAIYFATFILTVFGAAHDIILANKNVSGYRVYIMSEIMVLFVFIQAGLLIYKWVQSFIENQRLKKDFEQLNVNLESMIQQRTNELTQAKNKAESYSKQIKKQNKELTETIDLKNRVFSVIAHDLRSPVVNIQYILNLLKEEEYRDKYESLAGSCIQYSQMVINLLENMLVWGRGQEDQIRYAPDIHDLAGIILTNMSIYKDPADRKNISVNFTQIGGTKAWCDKELIDIIIRNLLSNAIKYTNRGGRISILIKEKPKPDNQLVLKICDNGVGISPERQALIFSTKDIQSTPGTDNEKGTGFGLMLSKELVKINKGTIEFESKPGEGTCFTITLPATREKAEVPNTDIQS